MGSIAIRLIRGSFTIPLFLWLLLVVFPPHVHSGVSNPDLSAIGQVLGGITTDRDHPDSRNPTLQLGESELVLASALNPYFHGTLILAGDPDGIGVEEAQVTWVQGLPWALGMKAGRYRLPFGKLNGMHPHALPFMEAPHAWQSLMPGGEDGFNEVAVQLSQLLSMPGNGAAQWSLDLFEGKTFHPQAEATRMGGLGHWGNSFLFGDHWALELGASGALGADAVNPDRWGSLWGWDLKSKWYFRDMSHLTFHIEGCWRNVDAIVLEDGSLGDSQLRFGAFSFIHYRSANQWNGGLLVEQWNSEEYPDDAERAIKLFGGYAVLEESTSIRFSVERQFRSHIEDIHTVALQLLFSMGPHKPHTF